MTIELALAILCVAALIGAALALGYMRRPAARTARPALPACHGAVGAAGLAVLLAALGRGLPRRAMGTAGFGRTSAALLALALVLGLGDRLGLMARPAPDRRAGRRPRRRGDRRPRRAVGAAGARLGRAACRSRPPDRRGQRRMSASTASTRPGLARPSGSRLTREALDQRRADHRGVGGARDCGGLLRVLDAKADRDRQRGEPAQPRDRGGDLGGIGRARAGDPGDRDVIEKAAGALDDPRQARARRWSASPAGSRRARRARAGSVQLVILLGRQIDDDDPVDPGLEPRRRRNARRRSGRSGCSSPSARSGSRRPGGAGRAPAPACRAGSCPPSARAGPPAWIAGPSAIGSENGMPISIRSAPPRRQPGKQRAEVSGSGSPAVR